MLKLLKAHKNVQEQNGFYNLILYKKMLFKTYFPNSKSNQKSCTFHVLLGLQTFLRILYQNHSINFIE